MCPSPITVTQHVTNVVGSAEGHHLVEASKRASFPSILSMMGHAVAEVVNQILTLVGSFPVAAVVMSLFALVCVLTVAQYAYLGPSILPFGGIAQMFGGGEVPEVPGDRMQPTSEGGGAAGTSDPFDVEQLLAAERALVQQHLALLEAARHLDRLRNQLAEAKDEKNAVVPPCQTSRCGEVPLKLRNPEDMKDEF